MCTKNCRSVVNKTAELKVDIITISLNVCILPKTWIRMDDSITEVQMCPPGYKVYSGPSEDKSGGGIAVIYKDSMPIKKNSVYDYISMECVDFTLTLPNSTIKLSLIYRPPDKSVLSFSDDFLNYMESNINSAVKNLFVSEFNIHVKRPKQLWHQKFPGCTGQFWSDQPHRLWYSPTWKHTWSCDYICKE